MSERDPGFRLPDEERPESPEGQLPHVPERLPDRADPHDPHNSRVSLDSHEPRGSRERAASGEPPASRPFGGGPDLSGFPGLGDLPEDTGLPQDEAELRRILRAAVDGIEPSHDALDHLREAVPARRRRRRQLLLGTAASVALLGVGAPLVFSAAAGVGGGGETREAGGGFPMEGDVEYDGGLGGSLNSWAPGATLPPGRHPGAGPDGRPPGGADEQSPEGSPDDPGETLGVTSPTCDRGQLGEAVTFMEPPDVQGRIYGLVRMANVSDAPCRVTGNGDLAALPLGQDTTADVQVVDRTEGDRATRLPDPEEAYEELVLPPGEAYEVRFAWVPSGSATGGCEAEPADPSAGAEPPPAEESPDPLAADMTEPGATDEAGGGSGGTDDPEGPDATGGEGDGSGTTDDPTGGTDDPGGSDPGGPTGEPVDGEPDEEKPDDGVLLRYTPAAGEPAAAQVRLEGACSGTVYRTGVLEAPTA
ncbi:DUF4232 domain-containing protein [Streptomyces litchfieldiae]|uniref:DUF4232 domain-containing protein n=1 Tax=Streptomyces litchfieldiae TaxID=3075543 RepID=A0ABU2MJZ6_9ACTN|nr:DUF4232 domain-containing protein [Streptomyces sp. DSM 44938]MDT0341931.1 DUF4232 domain-containing protein [Streptomyces sp. DSM 44938]